MIANAASQYPHSMGLEPAVSCVDCLQMLLTLYFSDCSISTNVDPELKELSAMWMSISNTRFLLGVCDFILAFVSLLMLSEHVDDTHLLYKFM